MLDLSGVLAPKEGRDIEVITREILDAKRRGGEAILTIGRCLTEAKQALPHGEWLPWLNERVEFSERTAQNFMRLAREWSNPQALADLGAAKALTLLALPAVERESFIAENHVVGGEEKTVIDMTSRELEKAIRERKEAQEAVAEMQGKLDKAKEAKAKADERRKQAEASVEILKKSIDEMERNEKKAALGADKDLAQFEVLFDQTQSNVYKMQGILLKVRGRDETAAGKLCKAIQALAEAVGRCAE